MSKKEFKGERDQIKPYRLFKEGISSRFDDFFLTLAVIYNDLKDLVLFQKIIGDEYRMPEIDEATFHSGEYAGITNHVNKLLIGHTHEFFKFLKENYKILDLTEFKEIVAGMSDVSSLKWDKIVNVALGEELEEDNFTKDLVQIRNNVSFHYYQAGKELSKSFCNYFYKRGKNSRNKFAYYALGQHMEQTRFFYADAAVEEYIRAKVIGLPDKNSPEALAVDYKKMKEVIVDANQAIFGLLESYLKSKKQ